MQNRKRKGKQVAFCCVLMLLAAISWPSETRACTPGDCWTCKYIAFFGFYCWPVRSGIGRCYCASTLPQGTGCATWGETCGAIEQPPSL